MIKCPNCGAAVNQPGSVVQCSFCGTQVRVQRRTGFFERAEPPPTAHIGHEQQHFAIQPHSIRWRALFIVMPIFIGLAVGGIVVATKIKAKWPR